MGPTSGALTMTAVDGKQHSRSRGKPKVAPAEGERRAQSGLVPQYTIAAEKLYALLLDGRLEAVGVADPEAETLDDIQIVRRSVSGLVLDAYQVKWGAPGGVLQDGTFRSLLSEIVSARSAIVAARKAKQGPVVQRVVAHLYTNQVASTAGLRGEFAGQGLTLFLFLEQVWRPAQQERISALAQVPQGWRRYVEVLAKRCGIAANELLRSAPDLRVDLGRVLPEESIDSDRWHDRDYQEDLESIRSKLQDLVSDGRVKHVWLSANDLVQRLGQRWAARWKPRQQHVFPTDGPYEPLATTASELSGAFDRFDQGYVALTGHPGAGKSTLLTRLLQRDGRLAASYYAFVPGDNDRIRGEADAFLHDLFLEINERQGRRALAPRENDLTLLHQAFQEQLTALGRRAAEKGRTEIVLIDGLDHVARDPKPHHPLLNELPDADRIPQGVLLVLGTRSLGDLPEHVRRGVTGDRNINMQPLSRAAVHRLCAAAGVPEVGERVAVLSGGHPLLARTFIAIAIKSPVDRRGEALAHLTAGPADVWAFYESVWSTISQDPDLVELVGLVCRMRGPIRLPWLVETGSGLAQIERLRRLDYLFVKSGGDRWAFFHSSFREYLRAKTSGAAELGAALHRGLHLKLADRCAASSPGSPERFDRLWHLLRAEEYQKVLDEATPDLFRQQVDELRPRDAVELDIRECAQALAECHDDRAFVRLALAAHEVQIRGYQGPESDSFFRLLVATGQPELALGHLRAIDNGTAGQDRRASAMALARVLHDAEYVTEAQLLFDTHEPLEWLGGRRQAGSASSAGDRPGLWAWARAAAVLRGVDYVVSSVEQVRQPLDGDKEDWEHGGDLPTLQRDLVWSAADELIARGQLDDADRLRAASNLNDDAGLAAVIALHRTSVEYGRDGDGNQLRKDLAGISPADLSAGPRAELATFWFEAGERQASLDLFRSITRPGLPERDYSRDGDTSGWQGFYRYFRLAALLRDDVEPAAAVPVPEKDYLAQTALTARHVVRIATLAGRHARGEDVAGAEVLQHSVSSISSGRRQGAETSTIALRLRGD